MVVRFRCSSAFGAVFAGLVIVVAMGCSSGAADNSTAGVSSKTGTTGENGRAEFTDSGTNEPVIINVTNSQDGSPVGGASVSFVDADGFEAFLVSAPGYISSFKVFPHNSSHDFELLPATEKQFTVFDYYFAEHPEDAAAWTNYLDWAEETYVYSGCMTREEMKQAREDTVKLISLLTGGNPVIKIVSTVLDGVVKLEEWGLIDTLPDPIYHIYEPMSFVAPGLAVGAVVEDETEDGIDNDCDGYVDEAESQSGRPSGAGWTNLGDGRIADYDHELYWTADKSPDYLDWDDAKQYCSDLDVAGIHGWRLPTVDELRTLVVGCSKLEPGDECGVTDPDCLSPANGGGCITYGPNNCACGEAEGCYWDTGLLGGSCSRVWSGSPVIGSVGSCAESECAWMLDFSWAVLDAVKTNMWTFPVYCVAPM